MKSSRERHKEKAAALEREINNNEFTLWLENRTHNSQFTKVHQDNRY